MKKSDLELLKDLKGLVARDLALQAELIRHLREVELRQLHLARGFSSMFAFCTEELGYSEPEAQIRIQAMRLTIDIPEAEEKIASGELSLSVAARIQAVFRKQKPNLAKKREIVESMLGSSVKNAEKKLAALFPEAPKKEKTYDTGNGTRINFTASDQLMEKFTRLKEILAHKNYDGRFDLLFEELADIALEKLEPKNNAAVLRTCKVKHSRYVPASVKRSLNTGCEYKDPATGRRCRTKHGLQFDHIKPHSRGGTNAPENLQRLCGPHNRFKHAREKAIAGRENTKPLFPRPRIRSQ